MKVCSIDGCGRPLNSRGWCNMHYLRWRTHGDPLHERPKVQPVIRTLRPGEDPPEGVQPHRYKSSQGYVRLRWRVSTAVQVECYEHRWVVGNPPAVDVHHINGVKDDNRPENLQIVTRAEHAAEHARWDAEEIGRLYLSGLSLPQIKEQIGVDTSVALRALRRIGIQPRSLSESAALAWANGRNRGRAAS